MLPPFGGKVGAVAICFSNLVPRPKCVMQHHCEEKFKNVKEEKAPRKIHLQHFGKLKPAILLKINYA